jgi:TatD DNase family protein
MKLFDAHCHLLPADAYRRAAASGVEKIAVCGTSSNDWKTILQLAEQIPQIVPMIGIHPWFVSGDWKESFQGLEKRLRDFPQAGTGERQASAQLVGIGECGLDFQPRFTNRAEQEECFAAHLELARELNRPVAVHCVQAWGRLVEILREHPAPRILLHAFGGAVELIPELTELNCWFSFCGQVTRPEAKRVRAAAAAVPAERLLIETDSPDFPPAGSPAPNEPANLIYIAREVASLRGCSVEEIAGLTFSAAQAVLMPGPVRTR